MNAARGTLWFPSLFRRFVCRMRGHDWSNEKSSVTPGHFCNRCKRSLA